MRLIPRFKPSYSYKEILAALKPSGGNIEKYEKEFAKKFQCRFGVMFPYGRSGLYSLLKVWRLKNTEIICPAYTCVVVPHAIVLSGNIPVFVDCDENSFNMSYEGIQKSITEKTRAIIATHLFGYPMNVFKINEIVKKAEEKYGHKIYVVQDVAHSFGAEWQGELVTKYGDAALFGLNISKIMNSIFGGMVITNSEETYKKLLEYREEKLAKKYISREIRRLLYFLSVNFAFNELVYGFVNFLERKGFLDRFVKYYDEGVIDMPEGWDEYPSEIEARVGLEQLKKYDEIVRNRKNKAKAYIREFENRTDIKILPYQEGATYSHCVALVENREQWINEYFRKGIQLGIIIEYSIPYMSAYRAYEKGEYPISKMYASHIINFPVCGV